MAIKNIEEAKLLKQYGKLLGRENISLRIIEICKKVAAEENYKDAVKACGQLKAIAQACKYDTYWEEKMADGYYKELQNAERLLKQPDLNKTKKPC